MKVRFQVDRPGRGRWSDLIRSEVPRARQRMVRHGLRVTLQQTIARNPVRTGRSRAAWQAALARLDGTSVSAGSGPVGEGLSRGSARQQHDASRTIGEATNAVRYVPLLEYGTSKRPAIQMVRRSLLLVKGQIAKWFRLGSGGAES